MNNQQQFERSDEKMFALASIMLLAPFVAVMMRRPEYELSPQQIDFIRGYVVLWNIILGILLLSFLFFLANYIYWIGSLVYIGYVLAFSALAVIFFWIFWVSGSKDLAMLKSSLQQSTQNETQSGRNFIPYYLPIYNIYQWYKYPRTLQNYRWLKESLLLWGLFTLLGLLGQNIFLMAVIVLIIVFRVISLQVWVDVIKDSYKESIDKVFENNLEEIWAYIGWSVLYLYRRIRGQGTDERQQMTGSRQESDAGMWMECVNSYKADFSKNLSFATPWLLLEYLLGAGLFIWIYYDFFLLWNNILFSWFLIASVVIFISRYIIGYKTNSLSHLPILFEIIKAFRLIIKW